MAKTSIHLKGCDIASSEVHNRREKVLDYVRRDLSDLNESFSFIPHSLATELVKIKREVKAKTGRALYKNAVPIKEGVIVIDNNTTMEQLQQYCRACQAKFGIQPLQIHIHRDEGHSRSKTWKPNLHAHIVWSMYDHEGRNVRLSKQDCAELQTMAAHYLKMERGQSSDRKHLSALQFKIEAQQKQIEELESTLTQAQASLASAGKGAYQGAKDLFTGKSRRRAEEAEARAATAEAEKAAAIAEAQKQVETATAIAEKAKANYTAIANEWRKHQKDLAEIDKLRQETATANAELETLRRTATWKEKMIEKFVAYGATKAEQWRQLFGGGVVEAKHICVDDIQVPLDNPIHLKLDSNKNLSIHDQRWCSEEGFWNGIRKGMTAAFEQGSKAYRWLLDLLNIGRGYKL